jgi:hypothetical protein
MGTAHRRDDRASASAGRTLRTTATASIAPTAGLLSRRLVSRRLHWPCAGPRTHRGQARLGRGTAPNTRFGFCPSGPIRLSVGGGLSLPLAPVPEGAIRPPMLGQCGRNLNGADEPFGRVPSAGSTAAVDRDLHVRARFAWWLFNAGRPSPPGVSPVREEEDGPVSARSSVS